MPRMNVCLVTDKAWVIAFANVAALALEAGNALAHCAATEAAETRDRPRRYVRSLALAGLQAIAACSRSRLLAFDASMQAVTVFRSQYRRFLRSKTEIRT